MRQVGELLVCPHCDQTPAERAVFCNHCGTRLEIRCQNCDTANPPNSRFCLLCGTPLFVSSGPPAHTGAAEPSPSPYVCPRCQAFNEPGSVYCHSCGLPLDEDRPSLNEAEAGVRTAGFWIRLLAYFIDGIILFLAQVLLMILWAEFWTGAPGTTDFRPYPFYFRVNSTTALFDIISLVLVAIYYAVSVSIWSTTIGNRILGLYVLRADGSKVGPGRALARWLAYIPSVLILGIGFVMIGISRDKRGLHDLMCGTVVVKR